MNVAYLSALSALAGSVVGGLTSGVTSWLSVRAQARAGQLAREMSRRDHLYKDSSSRHRRHLAMPSWQRATGSGARRSLRPDLQDARPVLAAYFALNRTIRELHELMKSGAGIETLRDFSEAARDELSAFTSL